jgi:LPXTG-motif cell wall-anchored protein
MLATVLAGLFVFSGPASAHQVTSIDVDCYLMTAHFSDFPDDGVVVHMAATVNGQAPVGRDVLVTSETTEATLDISDATSGLYGPLTIAADITWRYEGPQHVHETITVTCAQPTTTTTTPPTTTAAPTTTTTLGGLGSTSTVPTTGPATSTTAAGVSTTPTSGAAPTSTLPRTGSDATFPAVFGLSAIAAGVLALRRRRPWTA